MTITALSSGSEAPRKTAENTVKHRDGGVGSVVANHRGGGESSVVVTTQVDASIDDSNTVGCHVSVHRKIFLTTMMTLKSFGYGRQSSYATLYSLLVLRRFSVR